MKVDENKLIQIAIIEDNRFIRNGWEMLFHDASNFNVIGSYSSCEDAFTDDRVGNSDIVLMDLRLPGLSGMEGVKYIKKNFPQIEVLVCSAYEDDKNIFEAITAGAVGFIAKKAKPDELLNTVLMAVRGGSPITPNVARNIIELFRKQTSHSDYNELKLSDDEQKILSKTAVGKSYATVAKELSMSIDKVPDQIRNIYKKTIMIYNQEIKDKTIIGRN